MDADAWDERYAASDLVWSLGPNQFVAEELGDLAPGSALDLGCGEGRNALWLAERGWSVTAVDFSAVAVDRGRARAAEIGGLDITWLADDVLHAHLPGADLAVLSYLQLEADQRRTLVRRAFELLHHEGTLFVVAHDSTNLTDGVGGPQDASVLYTADDVLGDLAGGDFDVLRAECVARTVSTEDGDRTARDALVVVRRV